MDRRTPNNQRSISIGGAFDFVGNPNGYDVDAQAMSKALVNPHIDLIEKNEKSTCKCWNGASGVESTRCPLGNFVAFLKLHTQHVQSNLAISFNSGGRSVSKSF